MTLAYITCKDLKEAKKLSMHLLKKRLIACANIFPIRSMYWWNQRIYDESEYVLLAKTTDKLFKKLEIEVKRHHSYEVPCILRIEAKANKEYEKWVGRMVRK